MSEKWTMPSWMKKYEKYIIYDESRSIEKWMNEENLIFTEKPREFVQSTKVRVQVSLLKQLHKKGYLTC